jgi:anti-sigma factor RsiW
MKCTQANELLHAYADDELDLVAARQLEEHVHSCESCARSLAAARAVKTAVANPALYRRAPTDLRSGLISHLPSVSSSQAKNPSRGIWRSASLAASVLIVTIGGWLYIDRAGKLDADAQAVLVAHQRSIQLSEHQMDVASSDQHTVKPWIDARLDFAPPVWQLADQGFPLVGGRLDYLRDRPVAALVYHRGQHVINLFVWPSESGQSSASRNGYHLIHWSGGGMTFWAISDVNANDLQHFVDLFRQQR